MVRTAVLTLALVALPSFAGPKPSHDCSKQCDDALKPMLAQCRAAEKSGHDHDDHAKEDPNAGKKLAEACRDNVGRLKAVCLKQCADESSGRRR
ncbi:MAG: hypothetical protein MUC96_05950 [Myxococcaceae bacterium]|jgi:hypothetical protein|nr:hypothetical protein [Myxococcaceae bacterium]